MNGKLLRLTLTLPLALAFVLTAGCPSPTGPSGSDGGPDEGGPLPSPQIEVWQDSQLVFQGASLDCGIVCVSMTYEMIFTIKNTGTADLHLTGVPDEVAIGGADALSFTVVAQPTSPIAPNESSSFAIRFLAGSSGGKTATVEVACDDPLASPYGFTLSGMGLVPPAKVPATGQTTSYAVGDDGDRQMGVVWPAPRFVDNADGTVTDALTGLMWEKSPLGSIRTWENALTYCNNLELGGYTDWRLANARELHSLINVEAANPATWLGGQGFSGVRADDYWSSTTSAANTDMAVVIRIDEGGAMGRTTKVLYGGEYAWAVRGGQGGSIALPVTGQTSSYYTGDDGSLEEGVSWPSPRFRDMGDGTIVDNLTGLVWEKVPEATKKAWSDALAYADGLTLGGYSDWRLANKNELWSLIHYGSRDSASWLGGRGFVNVQSDVYWTSTTYAANTAKAWAVLMETGNMGYSIADKTSTAYYAWAVRGGE
jgi:hypothetical protein